MRATEPPATLLQLSPAQVLRYTTIGAAAEVDRILARFPAIRRALDRRPAKATLAALMAMEMPAANGDNGHIPPEGEQPPAAEHNQRRAPRPHKRTIKHPRGKQRNPNLHRTPRKRAAPVLEERHTMTLNDEPIKRRRHMSKAARALISARMRQYWARRRAQ